MRSKKLTIVSAFLLLTACTQTEKADLIIHNARIYTVDDLFSVQEAMAIRGDSIVEVGPEHQIMNKYGADEIIDAGQQFVYPGLIDAHSHFSGYAKYLNTVNLWGCTSANEITERVMTFVNDHSDEWITGRGWDQNLWESKAYPDNQQLNELFPEKYILLKRVDGHAALANQRLLELAGISTTTKIEGGVIEVKDGKCTGILIDNAVDLVSKLVPDPSDEAFLAMLQSAEVNCLAKGLTNVCDAGLDLKDLQLLMNYSDADQLHIRMQLMMNPTVENFETFLSEGPIQTEKYCLQAVKVYADGALGSRGALLLKPYSDQENHQHGLALTSIDSMRSIAKLVENAGFQLCTHAIGDSANRAVLNIYGEILKESNDRRWRIEHAQIVHPSDLRKFGEFNILPSIQPTHATSDGSWAINRLGEERIHHAYAYKSLKEQNGMVALGTDFPVEDIDPLLTLLAGVHRVNKKGEPIGGFLPDQALTFEECLRGMTIWAALASFQENKIGSLESGKQADFVIFNRDLKELNAENYEDYAVVATYIRGKRLYEKEEMKSRH